MSRDSTKDAMRKHKVWATVSNSSTTSGRLVRAGYILMKAPNLTHRIRFLQSLRAKMPDNTPFFDILHMKKTPAQQNIHHLVVQCGENHVEPLSQALSAILKGEGSSLYLPRLALGNLTTEKIAKYFTTHDNYIKSLKMIRLTPAISHLDVEREELLDNGQVVIRSTREWATTLKLPSNGICARCDVVNGGSDQATTLLVPQHNYSEVLIEVAKYRLRINPIAQQEERFRKNVMGLPAVIQINKTVQEALDCLEQLSSEEVWKQAPQAIRQAASTPKSPTNAQQHVLLKDTQSTSRPDVSVTSNLSMSSESDNESRPLPPRAKKSKKPQKKSASRNPQEDPSTQSITSSVTTQRDIQYQEMVKQLQRVQDQRTQDIDNTNLRLSDIDTQLKQLSRLDDLEKKAMESMQYHVTTNNALTAVQSQMSQMMGMLQDLAETPRQPRSQRSTLSTTNEMNDQSISGVTSHGTSQGQSRTTSFENVWEDTSTQMVALDHSTASLSSGSQHAKPPPKKHLKRSMPDAMEQMSLESNADDASSSTASTFGSPPSDLLFPPPVHNPPMMMLPPTGHSDRPGAMDLNVYRHTLTAMPDLDDQYKLTEEESNAHNDPDRGENG